MVKSDERKERYYYSGDTTKTFEKYKDWQNPVESFDISLLEGVEATFEINDDGIARPIIQGTSKGWVYKEEIVKIVVTSTTKYELLLRGW